MSIIIALLTRTQVSYYLCGMCIAHLSAHLCILSAYSEILDVSFYLNYVTPSYNNTEIFL